jgi:palmitoyltransferase
MIVIVIENSTAADQCPSMQNRAYLSMWLCRTSPNSNDHNAGLIPSRLPPNMLRWCNSQVVKCFKCLEHTADAVTGVAGPFFVGFACVLIGSGVLIFCESNLSNRMNSLTDPFYKVEVVAPTLPYPIINVPICMLIASNLLAHYYYVCTIHPGRPEDGLGTGEGHGWNWAPKRGDKGVKWSPVALTTDTSVEDEHTIPKCSKCQSLKPEVS